MAAYTTINDPEAYFQVKLYTGTNAVTSFTLDGDTDMQPDLVWLKVRSAGSGQNHTLFDSVRGVQKYVEADTQNAEATGTAFLTAFNSDGFTLGDDQSHVNAASDTYIAWCWKESATSGFDIGTYTGNATDDTDISHSLSAVPEFIICKNRATDGKSFYTFHTSLGNGKAIWLEDTSGSGTSATYWSDENPTSSVFTLGNSSGHNANTDAHIFYAWAGKQGFSKFGSFSGNGSATDGVYVHLGFKAAWFICKRTNASGHDWVIFNNKALGYNPDNNTLLSNSNAVEGTADRMDILSNGIKMYNNNGSENESGGDFIYAAFAESPFVNSSGVPNNAR